MTEAVLYDPYGKTIYVSISLLSVESSRNLYFSFYIGACIVVFIIVQKL
jgi:hypothetical protein